MPCQCASTPTRADDPDTVVGGCGCETNGGESCGCGSGPDPSDRQTSIERVVMDLDRRVRKLEASR